MGGSQSRDEDETSSRGEGSDEEGDLGMSQIEAKEEIEQYKSYVSFAVKGAQIATFMLGIYVGDKLFTKLLTRS